MTNYITISVFTLVAWLVAFGLIYLIKDTSRGLFVSLHYLIDLAVFGSAFYVYFNYGNNLPAFNTMVVSMVMIFVLEFIYWQFVHTGSRDLLSFVDWIVPAFIIAVVVYFTGKIFG